MPIAFPVDLPDPGIELESSALQADSLPTELSGKPGCIKVVHIYFGMSLISNCFVFTILVYYYGGVCGKKLL